MSHTAIINSSISLVDARVVMTEGLCSEGLRISGLFWWPCHVRVTPSPLGKLAVQSPPSWIANPFLRSTENILLIWNIREKKINSWIFNQKTKHSSKSYRELRNGSEEHEETFWSPPVRGTQPGTRQSSQGTEMDEGTESAFWKIRGERDPLDAENSIT